MEESDRFVFDVADSKPNTVTGNVFRVSWPLVHFENLHYNVSETAGYVSVNVKRTGNLNQVSVGVDNKWILLARA